jgi:glutathione S-transferase
MSLKIYGIVASRALRPLWAAEELNLGFEHEKTDYRTGVTREPEFLALNPNGHVPVVVDGDIVVWESMACALYLARHHGKADGEGIAPATPREDAEALRWSFWTMTELERDALTVLMHRYSMPEPRRRPELADRAESALHGPLSVLEQHLSEQKEKGQAHIAADRFTVADLCVASVLLWVRATRSLMDNYPLTSAWLKACLARPAYQAVKARG